MNWKYEMIIYWSNEDQAYIVEVPELPGCMADGRTYQEAVSNAEVIIAEWIETADVDALVAAWRATTAGSPAVLRDVEQQFRDCLKREEVRRCLARPSGEAVVWTEAPFDLVVTRDNERRIVSGRFDRLVVERDAAGRPAGATVVDFKSDRVETDTDLRARAASHTAQMRDYMHVTAQLLGLRPTAVKSVLLFTRVGRVVQVTP